MDDNRVSEPKVERLKLEVELTSDEASSDVKVRSSKASKTSFLTPAAATIMVALLGIFGTAVGALLQQRNSLELEERKFEYSLYSRAQEAPNIESAARLLDFYVEAGLIPGERGRFTGYLEAGQPERVPLFPEGVRNPYGELALPYIDFQDLRVEEHLLRGGGTTYYLSPNAGNQFPDGRPDMVVLHATVGPFAGLQWLRQPERRASVHLVIGRDGTIVQMVPFNYIAWGAGRSRFGGREGLNSYAIQISLENFGPLDTEFGRRLRASVDTQDIEIVDGEAWHAYTRVQINQLVEILTLLVSSYAIETVVRHDDVTEHRPEVGPLLLLEEILARAGVSG